MVNTGRGGVVNTVVGATNETPLRASGASRSSVLVANAKRRVHTLPARVAAPSGGPMGLSQSGYHVAAEGAVEFFQDGGDVAAEDAHPDLGFLEVLGDFNITDGDQGTMPGVIALDDCADFAAEQFVDTV